MCRVSDVCVCVCVCERCVSSGQCVFVCVCVCVRLSAPCVRCVFVCVLCYNRRTLLNPKSHTFTVQSDDTYTVVNTLWTDNSLQTAP